MECDDAAAIVELHEIGVLRVVVRVQVERRCRCGKLGVVGMKARQVDLGTRACFGDLGATVADVLGVATEDLAGESFASLLTL